MRSVLTQFPGVCGSFHTCMQSEQHHTPVNNVALFPNEMYDHLIVIKFSSRTNDQLISSTQRLIAKDKIISKIHARLCIWYFNEQKKTLIDEDVTNEYFDTGHILKITLNNK